MFSLQTFDQILSKVDLATPLNSLLLPSSQCCYVELVLYVNRWQFCRSYNLYRGGSCVDVVAIAINPQTAYVLLELFTGPTEFCYALWHIP